MSPNATTCPTGASCGSDSGGGERGAPARLLSLDALRGFDMLMILGADDSLYTLQRMHDTGLTGFLAAQFDHADWAGFRFYDLIFPLFLFMVGISIVFSLQKHLGSQSRGGAYRRIGRRFVLMFVLALIYSGGVSHPWPDIRLLGVLNRIALCYLFASLIFLHVRWRGILGITAGLLVGYWALLTFVPFPDVRPRTPSGELVSASLTATNTAQLNWSSTHRLRGVFEKGVNLANYVDQKYLPGRKWDGTWDPEGLLSTLPAVATCLLGVLAGLLIRHPGRREQRKVLLLAGTGLACLAVGWLWSWQFPVIKKIWTSSYVLVAAGWSALLFAAFHQVIEIWQWRRWTAPFVWIGANAITLYLANNFVNPTRLAQRLAGGDVKQFLDTHLGRGLGDLVIVLVALGLLLALARFLYQRRIFLRV
jgi:predicted acyltransferase